LIHLICPNPALDRTLLIKKFVQGTPNRPFEVREFPGGKSFNVAYALKQQNPDAEMCIHTIIGGHNGEYLRELAKEKQLKLITTKVNQNTRTCNILVDTKKKVIYPIYEQGLNLTNDILETFTQTLIKNLRDNDIVVFSGSLMKGMPDDYIADIKRKIKEKNIIFLVDTSGNPLIEAYKSRPHLIKINNEETLDLFPKKRLDTINDYHKLLLTQSHIPYFIITLGDKGVIAKMKDDYFYVHTQKVIAKNPVASGDFFLGILTNCISQNISHEDALKIAISYSTANCLNWYPEVLIEDVKNIFLTVRLKKL